jgi:hypothetical protein
MPVMFRAEAQGSSSWPSMRKKLVNGGLVVLSR